MDVSHSTSAFARRYQWVEIFTLVFLFVAPAYAAYIFAFFWYLCRVYPISIFGFLLFFLFFGLLLLVILVWSVLVFFSDAHSSGLGFIDKLYFVDINSLIIGVGFLITCKQRWFNLFLLLCQFGRLLPVRAVDVSDSESHPAQLDNGVFFDLKAMLQRDLFCLLQIVRLTLEAAVVVLDNKPEFFLRLRE